MAERLYYVFKIIQDQKGKAISGKDIQIELKKLNINIDIKTVYACIQKINQFFYEWIQDDMIASMKKTGFYIKKEFFLDGELQFLLDSIVFHADLNIEDKQTLKNKLLLLSSYHQRERLIQYQPLDKKQNFSLITNISTIMKAIDKRCTLSFEYINYEIYQHSLIEVPSTHGNHHKQYIISPYQIVLNNNHYYLIGYNEKHMNELSTYRIDRMRMIQTSKENFIEIREQFDMREEIEKMTNMYSSQSKETIQFQCQQKVLREIVSHFGKDIQIQRLYDDQYLITVEDVAISEGLVGWIFMLQDQIKIIAPNSLKEQIKLKLNHMCQLYDE